MRRLQDLDVIVSRIRSAAHKVRVWSLIVARCLGISAAHSVLTRVEQFRERPTDTRTDKHRDMVNEHDPEMRVGYVLVREDLLSPIIRSQLLDVVEIAARFPRVSVDILWFCRADLMPAARRAVRAVTVDMASAGVRIHAWPLVGGRFPPSWWELAVVIPQLCVGLVLARARFRFTIMHSRGYTGSTACALVRGLLRCRLIFDPRSPMPEERVAQGRWADDSISYRTWKTLERYVVARADATIATSEAFRRRLSATNTGARVCVIPNNYPSCFGSLPVHRLPQKYETGSDTPVLRLCYVGTFGHWNSIDPYTRFLKALRFTGARLDVLFVTPEAAREKVHNSLHESLAEQDISWQVKSLRQDQIPEAVSLCVAGMQLMDVADPRLSIKVVEYLASGLPVIVSENVQGGAEVVADNDVGFVLAADFSNLSECAQFLVKVSKERQAWFQRCRKLAREQFSPAAAAHATVNVYRSLSA